MMVLVTRHLHLVEEVQDDMMRVMMVTAQDQIVEELAHVEEHREMNVLTRNHTIFYFSFEI